MVAYLQDASDFQTFIFWGLAGKKKTQFAQIPPLLLEPSLIVPNSWLTVVRLWLGRLYNPYPSLYDGPWAEVEAVSLHHQCASWPWASAMVLGPKIQEKWSEKNWDLTLKMWEFVQICPQKCMKSSWNEDWPSLSIVKNQDIALKNQGNVRCAMGVFNDFTIKNAWEIKHSNSRIESWMIDGVRMKYHHQKWTCEYKNGVQPLLLR